MATPYNPLLPQQQNPPAPGSPATTAQVPPAAPPPQGSSPTLNAILGGLPAAAGGGNTMSTLAQMLGPQGNLSSVLPMAGADYADQLDQMEWNPMASWY